jgi:hypothetical protein
VVGAASAVTAFGAAPGSGAHHGPPNLYPPCPALPASAASCSPSDPVAAMERQVQPVSRGELTGSRTTGSTTGTGATR